MSTVSRTQPPRWLRTVVWTIAIALSVIGIVLSIVSSSWLPLICIVGGLALPMFPIGTPMTSRARSTVNTH